MGSCGASLLLLVKGNRRGCLGANFLDNDWLMTSY